MSHELRGTVGTILLCSEQALAELPDDLDLASEIRSSMEILQEQAQESVQLINATLEMYGSEARQAHPVEQDVEVGKLANDVAREISLAWKKSGVEIVWRLPAELPNLRTDPVKLKMILKNLVANAVKYTERGTVAIDVCVDGDGVQLSVSDTGI